MKASVRRLSSPAVANAATNSRCATSRCICRFPGDAIAERKGKVEAIWPITARGAVW